MKVKKIVIENFGAYYGRNEIVFLPDGAIDVPDGNGEGKKNVFVVYGENGAGKTTFLTALVWCLYGRQMKLVDVDWGYAQKKIREDEYLNWDVGKSGKQSVEIVFSDVPVSGDVSHVSEVSVRRERKGGGKLDDDVRVRLDGSDIYTERDEVEQREDFIRTHILPLEVAKFFLFDAQKIISFRDFDTQDQREKTAKAFSQVLGISRYEDLRARLEKNQRAYLSKTAPKEDREKFIQLEADEKKLVDVSIPETNKKYDEKLQESGRAEEAFKRCEAELARLRGDATPEQLEKLREGVSAAEGEIERCGDELRELYKVVPFAMVGKLCSEAIEQIENETKYEDVANERQRAEDALSGKIDDIECELESMVNDLVSDRNAMRMKDFFLKVLPDIIRKHFGVDVPDVPQGFLPYIGASAGVVSGFSSVINLAVKCGEKFRTLEESLEKAEKLKREKDLLLRKLVNRCDGDEVHAAEDAYNMAKKAWEGIQREMGALDAERKRNDTALTSVRRQLRALEKTIVDGKDYDEKAKLVAQLIDVLGRFIVELQESKRASLEKRLLSGTRRLMHKENLISDVEVKIPHEGDIGTIEVKFFGDEAKQNELKSMSEGERQLCASALLQALSGESGFDFPVFIDSPLQKFDRDHTINILKHFYPNVASQVVFFPLLGRELTRSEYEVLHPHVAGVWKIANIESRSHFEQEKDTAVDTLFPQDVPAEDV